MSDCTRTFVAIAVPEAVEQELARLQAELAPKIAGCRWNSTRPFHMTLAFLGDVSNRDLNKICATVSASVVAIEPFEVEVRGLGAFPNTIRPRVIWAGASATNTNALNALQHEVLRSLERINHAPDDKRFHPHVTLGRIKHHRRENGESRTVIESWNSWSAGKFTVSEVHVMASTLGLAGPSYEMLGRGLLLEKNRSRP
jgi:2'-5' RNA ligase